MFSFSLPRLFSPKKETCSFCQGTGQLKTEVKMCSQCEGKGCVSCIAQSGFDQLPWTECSACIGTGSNNKRIINSVLGR